MEDNGLDLRHTLAMLWHERRLILVTIVVVTSAAFIYSTSRADTYSTAARVLIRPIAIESDEGGLSAALDPAVDTSIDTQAAIIQSGAVAARASDAVPSIDPSLFSVEASPLTDNVVQVQVTSSDPRIAATTANAYVDAYLALRDEEVGQSLQALAENLDARIGDLNARMLAIDADLETAAPSADGVPDDVLREERKDLVSTIGSLNAKKVEFQASADRLLAGGGGQIVQKAIAPSSPSAPDPKRDAAVGFVLGAVLGVILCFVKEHVGRRIYTLDDAVRAARAPILASVPGGRPWPWVNREPAPRITQPSSGSQTRQSLVDERVYEAARELRAALAAHGLGGGTRRLVVLSAEPGQGALSTVVGLAIACAAAGMKTVLVAADIEERGADALFGSTREAGLTDILTSAGAIRDAVHHTLGRTSIENLMLLPAGIADLNSRDQLASPRLALVMKELRRSAAVVLMASPPFSEGADATILCGHAEGAVLAVRTSSARAAAVRHAADSLEDLGVPLLGLMLHDVGRLDEGSRVAPSPGASLDGSVAAPVSAGGTRDRGTEPEVPRRKKAPSQPPEDRESDGGSHEGPDQGTNRSRHESPAPLATPNGSVREPQSAGSTSDRSAPPGSPAEMLPEVAKGYGPLERTREGRPD